MCEYLRINADKKACSLVTAALWVDSHLPLGGYQRLQHRLAAGLRDGLPGIDYISLAPAPEPARERRFEPASSAGALQNKDGGSLVRGQ